MRKWDPRRPLRDGTYEFRTKLPLDHEGMLGRECPQEECEKYFKVRPGTGLEDSEVMYCPYCAKPGPADHFYTQAQIEYGKSLARRQLADAVHAELKKLERHSFRSALISMEIRVQRGMPPAVRRYVERKLETHVVCDQCGCEYAIYGLFAVCPQCAWQTLAENLACVRWQAALKTDLLAELGDDEGSTTVAKVAKFGCQFLEAAYKGLVTALETHFKHLNNRYSDRATDPTREPQPNLFQRLDDTRAWFQDQFGFDLFEGLSSDELAQLVLLFHKRHVLTHNRGFVDEQYLKKTGASREQLGRKVELTPEEVLRCADTVERIGKTAQAGFAALEQSERGEK